MSDRILSNHLARLRGARGWSQQELASRSGISRAEVSAIELGRLVPSTSAALKLAAALDRRVEDLFSLGVGGDSWAWPPSGSSGRLWRARVGRRHLLFPVEPTSLGSVPHDGTFAGEEILLSPSAEPEGTLVVAGCDPAVGLLACELGRAAGLRVLALTRSSREALSLLERGLVHAAGVHWSEASGKDANAAVVAKTLGTGFRLLHVARWQEGVALGASVRTRSTSELARSRVRWVAREEGSGARRCLDRLLGRKRAARGFRHLAFDHRGVALAIRGGWAEAGVAVRLAAEEAGLSFLSVQQEDYELCYGDSLRADRVLSELRRVMRGRALSKLYRDLPGYDSRRMGEERSIA